MEFGIFNLMNRRHRSQDPAAMIRQTVAQVQAAEAAGFATAWFTEHHFTNYSITPSPLATKWHSFRRLPAARQADDPRPAGRFRSGRRVGGVRQR